MNLFTKKTDLTVFNEQIEVELLRQLEMATSIDERYAALDMIARYNEYREGPKKLGVSPDTMAAVAGNLLGILLIMNHERLHVISTKALGFVIRARV